ncbi:MAG: hypothetical protein ACK5XS_04745 [Armatimonadota bacterium]|nr:hypothetical protein [Fimbriimonadaceae bacterium]
MLALFWMGVSLMVTVYVARLFAGNSGLDLLRLQLSSAATFSVSLSPWIVALFVVWAALIYWLVWPKSQAWEAKEVSVKVGNLADIKLTPNQEVAGIAHRAWAELVSRKAGMAFDEENDVINEVYDSWYKLFVEIRGLVKAIPVEKLRASEDAQKLCDYLLSVLNNILRPHLTKHQARFRSWYENELKKSAGQSPQDIQKGYPQYAELVQDLKGVNADFLDFERALRIIARGKE